MAALIAVAAILPPLALWVGTTITGHGHGFNDFHSYWLAGRLIGDGISPYDLQAFRDRAALEGLRFVVGTGYSYPLPFALLMLPFSWLAFTPAVLLFNAVSLAAFGIAVAAWLLRLHPGADILTSRRVVVALLAGLYPPVFGTVANGQANLVVLVPLAAGMVVALSSDARREAAGGILLGVATIVKLVPGAIVVPLMLAGRARGAAGLAAGAAVPMVLSAMLVPFALAGSSGLGILFGADPYFTNQSVNGFVSRLVRDSDRTLALAPNAFPPEAGMLLVTGLLAVATAAVLWEVRREVGERRVLAVALGFALVAATLGAPKNSFWNQALVLPAVGLLVRVVAPDLRLSRFDLLERLLLLAWMLGATVQAVLWLRPPPNNGPYAALVTLLQSSAFYGMLALWGLFARRLRWYRRGTPSRN